MSDGDPDPNEGWLPVDEPPPPPTDDPDVHDAVEIDEPPDDSDDDDPWLHPYRLDPEPQPQPQRLAPALCKGLAALFSRARKGLPYDPDQTRDSSAEEPTVNYFRRKPTPVAQKATRLPVQTPRTYTAADIRRDGWTPDARAYVGQVQRECAAAGKDASLMVEHYELVEAWEASATCWSERQAAFREPDIIEFMAGLKQHNRQNASRLRAMAEAGR